MAQNLVLNKVAGALPGSPVANGQYYLKEGNAVRQYVADSSGNALFVSGNLVFQALKTTAQTSGTAFADVTGWNAPTITESIYSFDNATGVLTINATGVFEVSVHALYDLLANNRIETAIKLVDSSGDVAGALDRQYSARNGTQDQGSAQLNNFLYNVATSGETLKVQELHVGANCQIIAARLTVKRVR